jgi:hypothetical protein
MVTSLQVYLAGNWPDLTTRWGMGVDLGDDRMAPPLTRWKCGGVAYVPKAAPASSGLQKTWPFSSLSR